MNARMRLAFKVLIGHRPGRLVTVFPDDQFIVSYPKSGNTWVRFLIAQVIVSGRSLGLHELERKVPDIYLNSERTLRRIKRPRMLKSHEYFDPRYGRVLYIVRDPRDVVVSYYHYHVKQGSIEDGYPLEVYVEKFLKRRFNPFGSWGENVGSWLGARRHDPEFLLIRYEDLLDDTFHTLKVVARFFGLSDADDLIERVIHQSSFGRLQELEQKEGSRWINLKGSRPDHPFFRKGERGGWMSVLPESCAEKIVVAWKPLLQELGYL